MITLVMGPQQQSGGESIALQLSPIVPSGDVTLRAVATLARPPGAEVAVWTVDGERAGVSTWTLVRRRPDGLSTWQTAITATLADGAHIVTVALRSLADGGSITAVSGGVEKSVIVSWMIGASPGPLGDAVGPFEAAGAFEIGGSGWGGTPPDPPVELIEVSRTATGSAMIQCFLIGYEETDEHFAGWTCTAAPGYSVGTFELQPVGPCLVVTRTGTAATGDYEFSATVGADTYGPLILRLT